MALLVDADVAAYVHGLGLGAFEGVGVEALRIEAVGGGNLNYAWRCADDRGGSVFVKQAPGYIKCLGEAYALTSKRMGVEVAALRELARIDAARVPRVLHFDGDRCAVVMEDLGGCELLRDELMRGTVRPEAARDLGAFLAAVYDATRGAGAAAFAAQFGGDNNSAMRGITEAYIFLKPWDAADETNRDLSVSPSLEARVAALRRDPAALAAAGRAAELFGSKSECLAHGDLHAGSVMTDGASRTVAIDAEFAFYGPAGFDLGLLVAGYAFAYCAADAHAADANGAAARRGACKRALAALWLAYAEARHADKDDLPACFADAAAVAASELFRRAVGAATVPDLGDIADPAARATAELLVVEAAASLLVAPPKDLDDLLLRLDSCYDVVAVATRGA